MVVLLGYGLVMLLSTLIHVCWTPALLPSVSSGLRERRGSSIAIRHCCCLHAITLLMHILAPTCALSPTHGKVRARATHSV